MAYLMLAERGIPPPLGVLLTRMNIKNVIFLNLSAFNCSGLGETMTITII